MPTEAFRTRILSLTAPLDPGQTPLDPDEAAGLLQDWITTRAELDQAETDNIGKATLWARRNLSRHRVPTVDFLCELHRRMFGNVWDWAGRYRTTERNIGVAPHDIAPRLRVLFDDAAAWLEFSSYPHDEMAARLHHRLTWIHPFPNGNGRCSRLMADYFLIQSGAPKFTWGESLAAEQRRELYLTAIRQADAHDFGPLLAFARG